MEHVGFNINPSFNNTNTVLEEVNKQRAEGLSESDINLNLGKDLINAMKEDAEILDLDKVQINAPFKGICWCINTKSIPNRFNPRMFDKIYTLISKNGTIFKVRLYSKTDKVDEFNIEDTAVYISGTAIMPYEEIVFRAEHVVRFDNLPLTLSCFIQELPDLNQQIQIFNSAIEDIKSPSLKSLIYTLSEQIGLVNDFKESAYKPFIGDKLGMKFFIFNSVISSVRAKANFIDLEETKDIIYSSLLFYLIKTHLEESSKLNSADNFMHIITAIVNSSVDNHIKFEIMKILSNGRSDDPSVSLMFAELKIIENIMRRN